VNGIVLAVGRAHTIETSDGEVRLQWIVGGGSSDCVREPEPSPSEWPAITFVVDGHVVGEARLMPVPQPLGHSGSAAQLVLGVSGARGLGWLAAALERLANYAAAQGISSLLAEPTKGDAEVLGVLKAAGFNPGLDEAQLLRELVPSFWRSRGVYVIAEAGSNWRVGSSARDMRMAKTLIDVAKEAGADAVKFQTFRPEALYVANAGSSDYLSEAGIDQSMGALFADISMPPDMLPVLSQHARAVDIDFMSTAFSPADFELVDPLVSVHKIASYEISHVRLIELAARSGKPTVMSTGAATLEDIDWAVAHYRRFGGRDLCLMQCTAKYPAPLEALNLATIPELQRMFGVPVGLSDHSRDPLVAPLAATALGARAIEKHFTLDNRLPGPDHAFAVTAEELGRLVAAVRNASTARGSGVKAVHSAEEELAAFAQRGVQAIRPIAVGDVLVEDGNVAILRPGKQRKGVHPRHLAAMAGCRATRTLAPGEGLRFGDWSEQ
jgi:N-acetylneuraminate synthase